MAEPVDLGDKNSVTGAIETIKTRSTVKELVKDLRESLPNIYSALVDERDEYMTQSLLSRLSEQPAAKPLNEQEHAKAARQPRMRSDGVRQRAFRRMQGWGGESGNAPDGPG